MTRRRTTTTTMEPVYPNTECNQCGKQLRRRVVARDTGDFCSVACADTHAEQTAEAFAEQDARTTTTTATADRPCKRCGQRGDVDHDNDIAICNRCSDAIQGGADPRRFDPTERMRECQVCGHRRADVAEYADDTFRCAPCAARHRAGHNPAPTARRGGARPGAGRKPTGKPTRTRTVGVRLTDAELATLTSLADADGQDVATWIRGVALAVKGAR